MASASRVPSTRGETVSCCTFSVFMDDFHYYWPKYHIAPPTEAQLKLAKSDWRAGNTGYEGVRNAQNRAAEELVKSKQVLTHLGGKHYRVSTQKNQQPSITVLPYMGPPKETEFEQRRKNYKPQTVFTDGVQRTPARIRPDWRE
jgi:hypothetical protein